MSFLPHGVYIFGPFYGAALQKSAVQAVEPLLVLVAVFDYRIWRKLLYDFLVFQLKVHRSDFL